MGKGGVLAMLPTSPVLTSYQNEIKEKQRQRLSFAGLLGAESRHKDTKELKLWGRKKATEMRGSHIEISRKLASQVPSHLHSASKDPERLFYDDLRANAKPS